ncbi:PilZ domain-containing protein [Sphingomonas xanthus]|uniref:PilZ domain-containing protein n=2 Tax=Sphingomonas xanthus TaxID=2594473 RepID=A0A516IS84_9SPHN|nr:PilZ domain-containing protein [Sphingomonas xanthus]
MAARRTDGHIFRRTAGVAGVEMGFRMIKARIEEARDERRRTPRMSVEIGARVRELGSEGFEARVLNISETGFMAEADGDLEVGTRIWLILPGRERANALVKWIAGNKIGAEFTEPISLDGLAA